MRRSAAIGQRGTSLVIAVLLAGALPVATARAAPGASAAAVCSADVNDVFAGAPRHDASRGAVDVRQAGRPALVVTRSSLKAGAATAGDRFGSTLALERTGAGCAVLAIGAPGADGTGAVFLAVDTGDGFVSAGTVKAPAGAAGDDFGASLVVSPSATPGDSSHVELWVGAPGRDVGSASDAGVVEHFRLTLPSGAGPVAATHVDTLRQGTPAVPTTAAEAGDRFGEVLAPNRLGVVVGVPGEDVGSAADAGMVVLIGPSSGTYVAQAQLTQNTPGIPGAAEAGDRFGAALAPCAMLIGVPGESIGPLEDAGAVQTLRGCPTSRLLPGPLLTQGTPGIPGNDEAGDRFGASVAVRYAAEQGRGYVIGIPGEDVGTVADAGSVVVEGQCAAPSCPWSSLTQGSGLPGTVEAGDQVGASLSIRHRYDTTAAGSYDTTEPLIGVPGEDVAAVRDAGLAYGRSAGTGAPRTVEFSGEATTGLRFGTVFATATYRGESGAGACTIAAAGDVAGVQDFRTGAAVTGGLLTATGPARVLALGDLAYSNGTPTEFTRYYDATWGDFRAVTAPAPGNHEYGSRGAAGYYGYFGVPANYSFDVCGWHVISVDQYRSASAAAAFITSDAAANPGRPLLVQWHEPRFSSGEHGSNPRMQPLWAAAVRAGATIVLNGHDHHYERFGTLDENGNQAASGTREFVSGLGGHLLKGVGPREPTSEKTVTGVPGVLVLTLRTDGYDWRLRQATNAAVRDAGTAAVVPR
ncbi:MAG TPA: metallophosphoesterase [Actinomycetales bacterium]|nr:metallophosphoesterase [Actinomycetales bacterium]